ncbi:MAG: damage-control phosphatase ARMT1 family protein [Promethearchaeota archaeon]
MKLDIQCIPCFLNQALRAINHHDKPLSRLEKKDLLDRIMEILKGRKVMDILPAKTGRLVYFTISDFLGVEDIYISVKRKSNELGKQFYERFVKKVDESANPLKTAAMIAIIGNLIDFGANLSYDLDKEIENLRLDIDHFELLSKDLKKAKNVLYFADNAGEIYFDKVFVREIRKEFNNKIYFVVRGGPIINDATLVDAKEAKIDKYSTLIEGTRSPGIILDEASEVLKNLYETSDVIISKGQGNFESLSEQPKSDNIYFMLKAKCSLMEKIFKVPVGSSILASWKLT